jgi:hypothetical protein
LKPSNQIASVSEAISQAINYKQTAHYTYIVIPNFNQDSFYNFDRFQSFVDLCTTNQVGIISVEMNVKTHEIKDFIEVVKAARTELEDPSDLRKLIQDSKWEACPLCNRIVVSENRNHCPWMVPKGEDVKCMKILLEESVVHQIIREKH